MKPARKPCSECPFRRTSPPGYLGSDEPESFALTALQYEEMPCHLTVDYERDDWREQIEGARHGTGRWLASRGTSSGSFRSPDEFVAHHRGR